MEIRKQTEQNNVKMPVSLPEKSRELQLWLVDQLTVLAVAIGEAITPQRLQIYAADLSADLSQEQLQIALTRARREYRFFPKIAELRELAGANPAQQQDAEVRKAWEVLVEFVEKWVQSDIHGNYVITRGVRSSEPPRLDQRILDTVRRTGGWRAYKCMTNDDFPFQQKRFLAEFEAWTAVEQVPVSRLLTETPHLQLVAKPMDPPSLDRQTKSTKAAEAPAFKAKPVPVPLTDVQVRDRREMLRQQAGSLAARNSKPWRTGQATVKEPNFESKPSQRRFQTTD